jgi:hypothetical protein
VKKTRHGGSNFVDLVLEVGPEPVLGNSARCETNEVLAPIPHAKAVLKTACNEKEWHIAHLPKTSAKACFAQQANTKKKCMAKIVQYNKSTAAPTYTGMMKNYKKIMVQMPFFFCNNDIERCVKGTIRKWVQSKPAVPEIWPVKLGTNLTSEEVLALEHAGFRLAERPPLAPHELFSEFDLGVIDFNVYPRPESPEEYPKRRFGKNIRRTSNAPTTKHSNMIASTQHFQGKVLQITMLPSPALGSIIRFESSQRSKASQYLITIGQFPSCDCPFFKDMSAKSLGKRGQWVNCKHMYYVFTQICNLLPEVDQFIHAPSFSYNEIKHVLEILLSKCKTVRTV